MILDTEWKVLNRSRQWPNVSVHLLIIYIEYLHPRWPDTDVHDHEMTFVWPSTVCSSLERLILIRSLLFVFFLTFLFVFWIVCFYLLIGCSLLSRQKSAKFKIIFYSEWMEQMNEWMEHILNTCMLQTPSFPPIIGRRIIISVQMNMNMNESEQLTCKAENE